MRADVDGSTGRWSVKGSVWFLAAECTASDASPVTRVLTSTTARTCGCQRGGKGGPHHTAALVRVGDADSDVGGCRYVWLTADVVGRCLTAV